MPFFIIIKFVSVACSTLRDLNASLVLVFIMPDFRVFPGASFTIYTVCAWHTSFRLSVKVDWISEPHFLEPKHCWICCANILFFLSAIAFYILCYFVRNHNFFSLCNYFLYSIQFNMFNNPLLTWSFGNNLMDGILEDFSTIGLKYLFELEFKSAHSNSILKWNVEKT